MIEIIEKYELKQIVDFYTHEEEKTKSTIDIVLTNDEENVQCCPRKEEMITDHETIQINIRIERKIKQVDDKFIITWKHYNKNELINILIRECEWYGFNKLGLNERVELFGNNITKAVEKIINRVKLNNNIKHKKWFDLKLSELKHKKIELCKAWRASQMEGYWS